MKPFISFFKYNEDKSLGINFCYEENEYWNPSGSEIINYKYKSFYININLIWFEIAIGIKTKPREE